MAFGYAAVGGMSWGRYAAGGLPHGTYEAGNGRRDPEVAEYFGHLLPEFIGRLIGFGGSSGE